MYYRDVRAPGLGLIPSWQFDMTAANPKINPHIDGEYPAGVTQETIQPLGPNYGLGGFYDSWAFQNRKLLVGGGLVVLGTAILAGLVKFLK